MMQINQTRRATKRPKISGQLQPIAIASVECVLEADRLLISFEFQHEVFETITRAREPRETS